MDETIELSGGNETNETVPKDWTEIPFQGLVLISILLRI